MSVRGKWPTMKERFPTREGVGPNGRVFCRYCGKEVPKRRRAWCSDECSKLAGTECNWNAMRRRVFEESNGICAWCKEDIGALRKRLDQAHPWYGDAGSREFWNNCWDWLLEQGYTRHISLWQVDHIVPCVEGGLNERKNLRLLCVPCHKRDTRELAAKLARKRRADKRREAKKLKRGKKYGCETIV